MKRSTRWTIITSLLLAAGTAGLMAIPADNEKAIAEKVSRARADLRSLHTAIESYKVDWDVYPARYEVVTTPVCYITQIPPDPFARPAPGSATQPPHRMRIDLDDLLLRLYSVGPDGVDDQGLVEYDPTNGTLSAGDLVRTAGLGIEYVIRDKALATRVKDVRVLVDSTERIVFSWAQGKDRLPGQLGEMTADGYIKDVPKDPFNQDRPLSYMVWGDKSKAAVYSFGPDGDDDRGDPLDLKSAATGGIPNGDISAVTTLEDVRRSRQPHADELGTTPADPYYTALLAAKEKTGIDNAMIHYVEASRVAPAIPSDFQRDLVQGVLANGWTPAAEPLNDYLALWQPAFTRIREGVRLDHAYGVGSEMGPQTPVPNFLSAQTATKLLIVEGNRALAAGDADHALDCHLTALTFGRDFGADGSLLIGSLISVAAQSISTNSLHRAIRSDVFDRPQLERLAVTLAHIEKTNAGIQASFGMERQCTRVALEKALKDAESTTLDPEAEKEIQEFAAQQGIPRGQVAQRLEQFLQEYDAMMVKIEAWLALPSGQRTPASWEELVNAAMNSNEFVKNCMPNYLEATVRHDVMISKLRMLRVETALALYRLDNGRYPGDLDALKSVYTTEPILDPFSAGPFAYESVDNGADYVLYGVGPDRDENEEPTLYDPTNGTVSSGEVYFR